MEGRHRRSPIEERVGNWEYGVKHLIIPTDSQVGGYDDFLNLADYEAYLIAREEAEELRAEAPVDLRAELEGGLRDADTAFQEKTDPDTMNLLSRSGTRDNVSDGAFTQLWLMRVPKHGCSVVHWNARRLAATPGDAPEDNTLTAKPREHRAAAGVQQPTTASHGLYRLGR